MYEIAHIHKLTRALVAWDKEQQFATGEADSELLVEDYA